jgi:hypothetical protein
MPVIDVIEPHDVILAQIAAHLHLDQLQRDFPRIGEAMDCTDRHVDRFIFVDQSHLLADRDLGDAAAGPKGAPAPSLWRPKVPRRVGKR